jgi:undecaprenyl phosphate N,N'-diacetylbacillosamine 1-phosphate transferase
VNSNSIGCIAYRGQRSLDLAGAGIACLVFAPLAVVITLAIWIEDRGSPFFTQTRIGARGTFFCILKFRTMREGAVTRIGRWLRRTGLDELPQFVNVCRGEMSIVGPRPLTLDDITRLQWYTAQHDWRFSMRPGITGLAQLAGGRSARHSARLDQLYLRRRGAALDVRIIALSFLINIAGKRLVRRWIRRSPHGPRSRSVHAVDRDETHARMT